jgi:RNA polymerase sigma factor (sigma-70 family)
MPLAAILAKYFLQNRPGWQRSVLVEDLQSEGYLALVKAARTYDPKRLPYPKAYFARAVLNAMYKAIKKLARQPGEIRITLEEAADLLPEFDHVDHIRLAIADLPEWEQELATDRFINGKTLRALAESHEISLRAASRRATALAKVLAGSLGIQLTLPDAEQLCHSGRSSP